MMIPYPSIPSRKTQKCWSCQAPFALVVIVVPIRFKRAGGVAAIGIGGLAGRVVRVHVRHLSQQGTGRYQYHTEKMPQNQV